MRRLGRIRVIAPGLVVFTPLPVLPVYYHRLATAANQRLLLAYVRRALGRLGWNPDVVWTYWPNTGYLMDRLGARLAVYHCIDDFAAAGYPFTSARTIADCEAAQCRGVQLVITRTPQLAAAKRLHNPNTHVVAGGVDTALFDPERPMAEPDEMRRIPRPRAGLVGTLDDRIDVDLLVHCARRLPHVAFVLAGPVRRHRIRLGPLSLLPNVYLLPPRPHADVPALIASLDVCLIPYRVNRFTESVSPLKLYEYLAMGKPVVATDLPYHRRELAHIHIARSPSDFAEAMLRGVAGPLSDRVRADRRAAAEAHSWDRQLDQIEAHLAPLLEPG